MSTLEGVKTRKRKGKTMKLGSKCKCSVCGLIFGGERGFDMHREGPADNRTCVDESRLIELGMRPDEKGVWRRIVDPVAEAVSHGIQNPTTLRKPRRRLLGRRR